MKRIGDFTAEERAVIRERLRYQPSRELAAVFDCDARTIAAIGREPIR